MADTARDWVLECGRLCGSLGVGLWLIDYMIEWLCCLLYDLVCNNGFDYVNNAAIKLLALKFLINKLFVVEYCLNVCFRNVLFVLPPMY